MKRYLLPLLALLFIATPKTYSDNEIAHQAAEKITCNNIHLILVSIFLSSAALGVIEEALSEDDENPPQSAKDRLTKAAAGIGMICLAGYLVKKTCEC